MRALTRTLLAGAAAASFLAAPATAATNCFGPQTMFFCLITPEASLGSRDECVYVGGTQCQNVRIPTVELEGSVSWVCGGAWRCVSPGS